MRTTQSGLTIQLGRFVIFTVLSVVPFLIGGCDSTVVTTYYRTGAIACESPIASQIGMAVFRDVGNAFDAAIAVGFVMAVTHPEAGNIGGGGFAVVRDGKSGIIRALDFREEAPSAANDSMFLDSLGNIIDNMSLLGAKAAGVPGTVAGLYELWQSYGTIPWENLVRYAADLADSGFAVDAFLSASLASAEDGLELFEETRAVYLPGDAPPKTGDRLIQKDLARTLYAIASQGADGFYRGETALRIDSCMMTQGGLITLADLASYRALWREPLHYRFDSLDIYTMPPPSSGGITGGQILKLVEPYDFSTMTPMSPEYLHLFCEAERLAFADRSLHLGDPAYWKIPDGLLSDAYLDERRTHINRGKAGLSDHVIPGTPASESGNTTHFSVCDKQGNMVSLTYTLNDDYGSKLVVAGCGFLLNNEMDDFAVKPGAPNLYGLIGGNANKIEPGKRMLSSMAPTIVMNRGLPFLCLGAPGGPKIISTVMQATINFTRFHLSLSGVVRAPRFHHQWIPDKIVLERGGFDINTIQALITKGHTVEEIDPFGSLQIIHYDHGGQMAPMSDPRTGNGAAGY
jgi:gamma-glutamyltranspeptidase / glutathione hydrolase